MIYLDNAATSYPKPEMVIHSIELALSQPLGNPGRGSHKMAKEATASIFEARETICSFFNIGNPSQLVFTKNATEALNIAIFGLLKKDDHVITTSMEHNSVLRPLKHLELSGCINLSIVWANPKGKIYIEDILNQIQSNTRLIVISYSSNVLGSLNPIRELSNLCRKKNVLLLLDASQGAGSELIDVEASNIDIMAFPGHKSLLGPQGSGGLFIREGIEVTPLMMGGTGSISESLSQPKFMPDILESGTLNVPGIVGLKAGIDFITKTGIENIKKHKDMLLKYFINGLERINGIKIFSPTEQEGNTGIVSISIADSDSNELSQILDSTYDIRTRSGLHCAPLAHKTLGTLKTGLVRFSFGYYNTLAELDICLYSLDEISKNLFKVV